MSKTKKKPEPTNQQKQFTFPKSAKDRAIAKESRTYQASATVQGEKDLVRKGEEMEKMGGQDFQDTANRVKGGLDVAEKMAEVKRKKVRFKKPQGK